MRVNWLCGSLLMVACSLHARAQEKVSPCDLPGPVSSNVALTLTLKGGQLTYHEGEIIPLQLAFTGNADNGYILMDQTSDHSGRHVMEDFCLKPVGRDPLEDFFGSGIWGPFDVGGLGGWHSLDRIPFVIGLDLNEFKSLPPGDYTMRVISHRIRKPLPENGVWNEEFLAASNTITFQVIDAPPEWQAVQLAQVLSVLDAKHPSLSRNEVDQIEQATRVLRYLNSESATRELARRFWSHDQPPDPPHTPGVGYPVAEFYRSRLTHDYWAFKFGLIGSSYRAVAIQELKAAIDDPHQRATREMVATLALLEIQSNPQYKLPPYDSSDHDEWMKLRKTKVAAYNDLVAKLLQQVQ